MTPMMETQRDRMEEIQFENIVKERGYIPRKLPNKFQTAENKVAAEGDWMIFHGYSGKLHCIVEFKRRYVNHDAYPTLIVGLAKWMRLKDLASACGLYSAYIVIKYNDEMMVYEVPDCGRPDVRWGGRTDRGLNSDMEPVVHIDHYSSITIEEWVGEVLV